MNFNLKRQEYYNEDYNLNEQEQKEFIMPVKDSYWLVKSRAFLLDVLFFGDKSTIQQNIEIFLFNLDNSLNQNHKFQRLLNSSSEARVKSGLDLYEKRLGYKEENYSAFNENLTNFQNLPGYKIMNYPIYSYIPELKLMKKFMSYPEMYCVLSKLADPQMVFINMFKENANKNLLSGVIYFPFTPSILQNPNISTEFIINFSKYLNIHCNYSYSSESEKIKILKQKLMDAYYLVEDSGDLHGITTCMSTISHCENISSFFCENNLCQLCCQKSRKKDFCVIHDDMVNYYRKKMQEVLEFEQGKKFDLTKTIRITVRQRITKSELRNIFEDKENAYDINWENIEFLFRRGVNKIQYIYIQCNSNEEARRLYDNRSKIIKNGEKFDLTVNSLMENLEGLLPKLASLDCAGLLVVPCSSLLLNNKKLPKKSDRNKMFSKLIETSLLIDQSDYSLSNCRNLINGEFSYDYFLVEFKNKKLCDKFYDLQPYMDAIIFHKLNHLKIFPLINKLNNKFKNKCINCIASEKNLDCHFELCSDCCARQSDENFVLKITKLVCPCSIALKEEFINCELNSIASHYKCRICNESKENLFNDKCYNLNKFCINCCSKQMIPVKICSHHTGGNSISVYAEENKLFSPQFNFQNFITNYQLNLSLTKLKLNSNLKNGDFNWFRPISDTNLTRLMLDMNRELQIVMDNGNYKREDEMTINDKMYKIFSFQNESILKKVYEGNPARDLDNNKIPCYTTEGFDCCGEYYVDYSFTNDETVYQPNFYVDASVDRLRTSDFKFIDKDLDEMSSKLMKTFHLVFYGLDVERFTTNELVGEIFEEIKAVSIKIIKDEIIVLDEDSIINFVITNSKNFKSYDSFLQNGRFAVINFPSEKDALKIFLEKVKLNLPLANGKKGMPSIYPSDSLIKYLEYTK